MTDREIRERTGLSLDAVSRLAGVTPYTVKRFEDGEGAPGTAEERLETIYGAGMRALLMAAGIES